MHLPQNGTIGFDPQPSGLNAKKHGVGGKPFALFSNAARSRARVATPLWRLMPPVGPIGAADAGSIHQSCLIFCRKYIRRYARCFCLG